MLWVAGVPTSLANLPATGTATYTGHAIANIASGGSVGTSYLAAGTFSAAVNFGARNGAITIGGLDGTNYAPRKRHFRGAQAIGRGGGARSEVLPVRPCRERLLALIAIPVGRVGFEARGGTPRRLVRASWPGLSQPSTCSTRQKQGAREQRAQGLVLAGPYCQ